MRFLRYLSRVFSAPKKNPCYFCDFCDIRGHFGPLLGFFFFLSLEFRGPSSLLCFLSLKFCYICYFCDFCDFCDICHGCFKLARKILLTFAIFAIFADISAPFLASLLSKSGILLHVIFAIFAIFVTGVLS